MLPPSSPPSWFERLRSLSEAAEWEEKGGTGKERKGLGSAPAMGPEAVGCGAAEASGLGTDVTSGHLTG